MFSMENALPTSSGSYRPVRLFNRRLMTVFALVALTCIVYPLAPGVVYPNSVLDFLKAALATTQGRIVAVGGSLSSIGMMIYAMVTAKACSEADLSTIVSNLRTHWTLRNDKQTRKNEILKKLPGRRAELNKLNNAAATARSEVNTNVERRRQIDRDLNNPDLNLTKDQRAALQSENLRLLGQFSSKSTKANEATEAARNYNLNFVAPLQRELSNLNNEIPSINETITHYEGLKKGKESEIEGLGGDLQDLEAERSKLNAEYKRLKEEEVSLINQITAEEAKSQSGSQQ